MKTKISTLLVLVGLTGFGGIILSSCTNAGQHEKDPNISHYTCPMHPQIHEDHPGECPICHMKLVPVYKDGGGMQPQAPTGGPSVQISPERQQLIGIKTAMVLKKPVAREIRTVGRVAFDQELATAQREFLEIARNVPSLKSAATSRLRIMGMSEEEIRELDRMRANTRFAPTSLYLPSTNDSVWVYATLFPGEMDLVPPGTEAEISVPSSSEKTFTGTVRAVDPIVDPATRSVRARIEVPKAGGILRPDTFVNVSLKVDLGEALTIPKSALIDTGTRKVAFVVQDGNYFQSREIRTGPEVGDEIVVLEGLEEGETVVATATFLVDSESQLKAAVSGMAGHQH